MALLTLENNTEDYLKNIEIETFDESMSFRDCTLTIVAESERLWNDIVKEMAIEELKYVAENSGSQMIYESSHVKDFFDKVVKFFQEIGAKIAGFFKKVYEWIEDHLDTNKGFIKKYEKDIKKGFEIMQKEGKGIDMDKYYTYENIDSLKGELMIVAANLINHTIGYDKVLTSFSSTEDIKAKLEVFDNNSGLTDELLDKIRAILIQEPSSSISASEFKEKAIEYLRGEKIEDHVPASKLDVSEIISSIRDCVKMKRACSKSYKDAKKEINKMIKDMNRYKKDVDKDDANRELKLSYAKNTVQLLKGAINICTTLRGVHMGAYKDHCKQSKAIATKLVKLGERAREQEKRLKERNKGKTSSETSTEESFTYQYEDDYGFFTSDLL